MLLALATLLASRAQATGPTLVMGVLSKNTVWTAAGNPYMVQGDLVIPKDITLTIEPGCDVRLEPTGSFDTSESGTTGTDIVVQGTLKARGTAETPISFSSTSGEKRWGAIYFGAPTLSDLAFAYVLNGKVICNGSSPEITHCCVYGGGGIEVGHGSNPTITGCVLDKNTTGLLYWFPTSGGLVEGNKIFRNRYGVYVKEFSSITMMRNAIYDNTDYNLCNLSSQHAVDVRGNWWGTTFPLAVEQRIYDGRKKEGLGWVVLSPLLEQEVAVALLAPPPFLQSNVPVLSGIPMTPATPMLPPQGLLTAPLGNPPPPDPALDPVKTKSGKVKSEMSAPVTPTPTPEPEDAGPWKSRW